MTYHKFKEKIKFVLQELSKNKEYLRRFYVYGCFTSIFSMVGHTRAYAEGLEEASETIRRLFDPIIELLASIGYPATYAMIIVGGLLIITGKKQKGIDFIKWASVGYIILQFTPFILGLLDTIGRELRSGI